MLKGPDGRPKVYKSVAERCAACRVMGGEDIPCVSEPELAWYREKMDQECPRVELDPENNEAGELVGFCLHDNLKGLSGSMEDALLGHLPADERASILRRVAGAIRDPQVSEVLYPKPKGEES
jgi:hypothetical protein